MVTLVAIIYFESLKKMYRMRAELSAKNAWPTEQAPA